MTRRLTQLVPQLPPSREGVGVYAEALGRQLSASGVTSHFLAPRRHFERAVNDRVAPDATDLLTALAELETGVLLLHYVNYGYDARGCPSWLIEALARWRGDSRDRRLLVYFHEIYATGPPWRSSFWLFPRQRSLALRLAQCADAVLTSNELYADILNRWSRTAATVLPMVSGVGEPDHIPRQTTRRRELIVFGGTGLRRRVYSGFVDAVRQTCSALDIERIVDIGEEIGECPNRIGPFSIERLGSVSSLVVSDRLRHARAGFLVYPQALLAKSTVYAAYCAHGVPTVCPTGTGPVQGLISPRPGIHFASNARGISATSLQAIADQALAWYRMHNLEKHTATIAAALASCAS